MTVAVEATAGWQALKTQHDQLGLHIGPRTCVPKRFGERMDYGEAIGALRDADDPNVEGSFSRRTCRLVRTLRVKHPRPADGDSGFVRG
jgi:hypothetical protein